jgi:alpha/beta superfamily hydrolase
MSAVPREQDVTIAAGPRRLAGRLALAPGARTAAVLCHPHPQYGGDMDNVVVTAAADALRAAGVTTLRFNFRGVGGSTGSFDDGRGERADACAALAFLREHAPETALALVGYSFGALVAVGAAAETDGLHRLVAIAPPLAMAAPDSVPAVPTLLIVGDRDQYCSVAALEAFAAQTGAATRVLAGADHFFGGGTAALAAAVTAFILEEAP